MDGWRGALVRMLPAGLAIGFITAFAVYQSVYPALTDPRCDMMRDTLAAEKGRDSSQGRDPAAPAFGQL
jgi:hypothetical protein